jgi:hypothetical protein
MNNKFDFSRGEINQLTKNTNENYTSLRMEGYSRVSSELEPAFEADDKHGPAKCKARDSNSNIKEHHNICRAHR